MKIRNITTLAVLLGATLLNNAAFAKEPMPNWMFLQHSKTATVSAEKSHCYDLRLEGLHKSIVYFGDQPNDQVGKTNVAKFLTLWKDDSTKLHNAALHAQSKDGSINRILTLAKPQWNAVDKSLTYHACITDNHSESIKLPEHLSHVVLFIDPINGSLWG